MDNPPTDPILSNRIDAILATEKGIDEIMKCAREIIQDLGKEKQIGKNKMEENANTFKKLVTQVENELASQMQYLSNVCVGSAHQGSTFGVLQNSLLAQSGLYALHTELGEISTELKLPSKNLDGSPEVEEDEDDVQILEDEAPTSNATSSSAPRSQEERRTTGDEEEEEEEEQMEQ